jgi:hypothetical protein
VEVAYLESEEVEESAYEPSEKDANQGQAVRLDQPPKINLLASLNDFPMTLSGEFSSVNAGKQPQNDKHQNPDIAFLTQEDQDEFSNMNERESIPDSET